MKKITIEQRLEKLEKSNGELIRKNKILINEIIKLKESIPIDIPLDLKNILNGNGIDIRDSGNYKNKGFWLSNEYQWSLVKDSADFLVLIPKKI